MAVTTGTDHTEVIAYQAYVEKFKEDLFRQVFLKAKSIMLMTGHEGVKGRLVLTELIVNKLARRYGDEFRGFLNTKMVPLILEVVTNTVEHSVIPKNYEKSYVGMLRKKGQNSDDYPKQAYILAAIVSKLAGEIENALWQAEAAGVPAADDYMDATFDGILKQVADAITATTLTPVATGTLTPANILESFEDMFAQVLPQYQELGTDIFCSYPVYNMWRKAYKLLYKVDAAYAKIEDSDYNGTTYTEGNNTTTIIPVAGMGSSQRVIMTPRENLHYGYDDENEWSNFDFEKNHRRLDFWTDFNIGVTIGMVRDGIWVVNDQA